MLELGVATVICFPGEVTGFYITVVAHESPIWISGECIAHSTGISTHPRTERMMLLGSRLVGSDPLLVRYVLTAIHFGARSGTGS